ncbi:MAG: aminotransferase class I/II-fold pyridoxal phosphate-dependent enzyme [Methylocystaceae bacterium]|nr:aminotransferase class I/II-fold pyridoxal phosphate-dependent enzyme [Methylocystaceae bacterium]
MFDQRFIPLLEPNLTGNEKNYLMQCIDDNWISSAGSFVTTFEQRVAEISGTKYAVSTMNGTTALSLLLISIGIQPSDYIIVPNWTFAATANAVAHICAKPFFADVCPKTGSIDEVTLRNALQSAKEKKLPIKGVIAVHPLGNSVDLDPLLKICNDNDIPLIEDAAGALGSKYKNRPLGSIGKAAIISFNGNKIVTAGGGGIIVTNDEELATTARHLSTQARVGSRYIHDKIGYNLRMTNLCAAVGVAQLERLDEIIQRKKEIAAIYDNIIVERTDLKKLLYPENSFWNGWMYALLTSSTKDADSLITHLNDCGIGARHFWSDLSIQDPYRNFPRSQNQQGAHHLSETMVTLPNSCNLSKHDIERICEALVKWTGRKGLT